MRVEIRPAARLRGPNAVDLLPALGPVLDAVIADSEVDLTRLRVTADWSTVAPAQGGAALVQGTVADLLQVTTVDPRVSVIASAFRDPNGDPDVLIVQAVASGGAASETAKRARHPTARPRLAREAGSTRTPSLCRASVSSARRVHSLPCHQASRG